MYLSRTFLMVVPDVLSAGGSARAATIMPLRVVLGVVDDGVRLRR
jgi:hypothetical protein